LSEPSLAAINFSAGFMDFYVRSCMANEFHVVNACISGPLKGVVSDVNHIPSSFYVILGKKS